MLAGQQRHRLLDAWPGQQRGFDFPGFDAVTVQFELEVGAPEEFDVAVGVITRTVAGAVPTQALIVDKAFSSAYPVAAIALGNTGAADPQFAGHPVRAVVPARVDDAQANVIQWRAIGQAVPGQGLAGQHFEQGRVNGGFGGTAQGHEAAAGGLGPQPWRQVRSNFVAT